MDETVSLKSAGGQATVAGRLHASRCFSGEWVSCSFRATSHTKGGSADYHRGAYDITTSAYNPGPSVLAPASAVAEGSVNEPRFCYSNSVEQLCDVIFQRVFSAARGDHGLIVISGATATGKSRIARGLIYKYLEPLVRSDPKCRRPHLVTFEDPIDKYWAGSPDAAEKTGIDYTPREWKKDVDSLRDAVNSALRQTPQVFFAGETRDPRDWTELFRFASTGHLAITTSHAGSLTEAMGQLLSAMKATNPARRSQVANRILALVHLRSAKIPRTINGNVQELQITIPAVWVRSGVSTKALMADGLTALLPYRDTQRWDECPGTAGAMGCLGRSWFAEQLLSLANPSVRERFGEDVVSRALTWDLEGL